MMMSANEGMHDISMPTGERKPREIAMALTAWFTAPAPTACISTGTPSLTMPAMAPATEAGDDFEETLRQLAQIIVRLSAYHSFRCSVSRAKVFVRSICSVNVVVMGYFNYIAANMLVILANDG